jgi:diphthine methyl ester synthase
VDLGPPLHSLVLLGSRVHDMEREFLVDWAIDQASFEDIWRRQYERSALTGRG